MGSDVRNKWRETRTPKWKFRLAFVKDFCMDEFPDKSDYFRSLWASWESRVRNAHKAEEQSIAKRTQKMYANLTSDEKSFIPDDLFADEYWQMSQLTNVMNAALVVALWSRIEHFLKALVKVCVLAKNSKKKPSYKFDEIKKYFKQELVIDIEKLPKYHIVDAIRILNNCFKHSNGYYLPDKSKPQTQIKACYLRRWRIRHDKEINYAKLPINELVVACNPFCFRMLSAIKKNLERL